jgi:hypothetical protein
MPKVQTFAGHRPAKKNGESVERFSAIATGCQEQRTACEKKGIKFDMTQRQYWGTVVNRRSM